MSSNLMVAAIPCIQKIDASHGGLRLGFEFGFHFLSVACVFV
jgi:hypothetical protein